MEIETLANQSPAPWRIEAKFENGRAAYYLEPRRGKETETQVEANRRLMEKAPELLNALKQLVAEPQLLQDPEHLNHMKGLIGATQTASRPA